MPVAVAKKRATKSKAGAIGTLQPSVIMPPLSNQRSVADASRASPAVKPIPTLLTRICAELVDLQRRRSTVIKLKNMQLNQVRAVVAIELGYKPGAAGTHDKTERTKLMKEADKEIKLIDKDKPSRVDEGIVYLVKNALLGINAFITLNDNLEKAMKKLVRQLPVYNWINQPEQAGVADISLAKIIGEVGDLHNYPTVAKLWRMLGCSPYEYRGKNLMGSTWSYGKEGSLPAEEWTKFGYCKRRRAVMYVIGENLVRSNYLKGNNVVSDESKPDTEIGSVTDDENYDDGGEDAGEMSRDDEAACAGPYRRRYLESKVRYAGLHPDYAKGRCHRHGMLLAAKLLLKNLWVEWRK